MGITNKIAAVVLLNPTGGSRGVGSEVACMLRVPRASGILLDAWPEGCGIPN